MHSTSVAEWIVSSFMDQDRASSVVGDLVELKPQKGRLWFWRSLVGIVFSLTWKRPIAFIAAMLATFLWMGGQMSLVMPIWRSHAYKLPGNSWLFASSMLDTIGTILLTVLMYSVIRYGFRDRLARLTLVLIPIVAAGAIYCWLQSTILAVSIVVGILAAAAYIADKERIKEALALAIVIVVGSAGSKLASHMSSLYLHHLGYGRPVPPSAIWILLCISFYGLLLTTLLVTKACSHAHNRLVRNIPFGSEIEN